VGHTWNFRIHRAKVDLFGSSAVRAMIIGP